MTGKSLQSGLFRTIAIGVIAAVAAPAGIAFAQDDGQIEEIVVKGYKGSLRQSLAIKRNENGVVDSIIAEDIADFPDLNLAEAIQRIPGVSINRMNGEGRQITVRGLGSRYTQTKINGMETRAAVAGNSSRGFDFNMFASELFNNIVVNKTATASLEEGPRPHDHGFARVPRFL